MLDKIFARCERVGDCLIWTGCLSTDGYPRMGITGNSNVKVHRLVFHLVYGFKPPLVRHTCDEPKCLNPEHMLAGTPTLKMVDRSERGRTHGHVSDEEITDVKTLRSFGNTHKSIAELLGSNRKRVAYILNKLTK